MNFVFNFIMLKHYTIPVFIPELACPFQCAFCNQRKISGHISIPDHSEVIKIVNAHLASFKQLNRSVDVAFFGGNFTGLPLHEQEAYLKLVQPFLSSGEIQGIRLSTRPDYINPEVLNLLSSYQVTTIEIGAQSFDDKVLKKSHRGHTARQTEQAAKAIIEKGFQLGLQMMIGLPGDSLQSSLFTASRIVELGATSTRIYPTLVIKDTALHDWYKKGRYTPLSLEEAVHWTTQLLLIFEKGNVKVIRTGLHPSEGLVFGKDLVAGPYHPQFRELVLSAIWVNKLRSVISDVKHTGVEFIIPKGQLNYAIGHKGLNRLQLLNELQSVKFTESTEIKGMDFKIRRI